MFFSTTLFDEHNRASVGFKDAISKMMELGGTPNSVDFFPFLGFLDPQGLRRQTAKHMKGMNCLLPAQKRPPRQSNGLWQNSFGIRRKMKMVCRELDELVGENPRVEESDLESLHYLHAAVKEIFRLHPTAPLLLPQKVESTYEIGEFVIPKDSEVMVNVWAMGRDPTIWKEPSESIPERFLEGENSKMEYRGHNYELIPFGAGRRICIELPSASRMVHLVVASLVYSLEWTLPDGMRCEEMDMSEEFKLALKKGIELNAILMRHHIY
ncbi:hypothetical protein KI387_036129 [Taxus chinensis]|uniref:Cytochrome P450 n=1 Tax=Taxus chinensis TaxID=29808 RepID=A0AA38FSZ9_TAXCH|nr:hypothetical protein KI387_036129 [Taxus chinensis]